MSFYNCDPLLAMPGHRVFAFLPFHAVSPLRHCGSFTSVSHDGAICDMV